MTPKKILLLLLVLSTQACPPGDPIVENGYFDRWCDNALCDWTTETGTIARVATWHPEEYGVAFQSDPTRISQELNTSFDGTCLHLSFVSDVGPNAILRVHVDIGQDGTYEHTATVGEADFEDVEYTWQFPNHIPPVNLVLEKVGSGATTVARVLAEQSSGEKCVPIATDYTRTLGNPCDDDAPCTSGLCSDVLPVCTGCLPQRACVECTPETFCAEEQVCGVETTALRSVVRCVPPAQNPIGYTCISDAECTSGSCCSGHCSACCAEDSACADGLSCTSSAAQALCPSCWSHQLSFSCTSTVSSDAQLGGPDSPCAFNEDCRSGVCDGELLYLDAQPGGGLCDPNTDLLCYPASLLDGQCR